MAAEVSGSAFGQETIDKVAELLNEAAVSNKDAVKLSNLKQVQELILRKNSDLLDNFLDEVLDFQIDKSPEIRKTVISFIEESCKKDAEIIFKVIDNFRFLLYDENINVQKKAILSMINIFKCTIKCVFKHKQPVDEEQYQTWVSILDIKSHIASLLESDNDGIRTAVIKFFETLVIIFSPRIKESMIPASNDQDFSIDQIDKENAFLDRAVLAEEGRELMRKLLKYTLSTHISSVNLIASICALSNISRQRPEFMEVVLETYSKLIANMPPTLGKSQVSTVRKQLKLQLALVCKNPCCLEFINQITTLLSDLGASNNEIAKILPKQSNIDGRKRGITNSDSSTFNTQSSKKFKPQSHNNLAQSSNQEEQEEESKSTDKTSSSLFESADSSVEDITEKLHQKENITDLVIVSMAFLPEQIPSYFKDSYKPVANPGGDNQIKNLARLFRQIFVDAGLIKKAKFEVSGTSDIAIDDIYVEEENENEDLNAYSSKNLGLKLKGQLNEDDKEKIAVDNELTKQPYNKSKLKQISIEKVMPKKSNNKIFKLNEITNEQMSQFNVGTMENLLCQTKERIFKGEESLLKSTKEASIVRKKIIVNLSNNLEFQNDLVEYIFDDPRKRIDIALLMIYNSYIKYKKSQINFDKFKSHVEIQTDMKEEASDAILEQYEEEMKFNMTYYDQIVYKLFNSLHQKQDQKEMLFSRFICLLPHLSESILRLLKSSCLEEKNKLSYLQTLNTLSDLIVTRYAQRENLLTILLDLTHQNQVSIRENAIGIALNLYERPAFKSMIQEFSTQRLRYLICPKPPPELLAKEGDDDNLEKLNNWDEDTIKSCLYLFLELISVDHSNIHCLSEVYIVSPPEVKKVILKMIDQPIRKMGMESSELLQFLQNFSNGSETLVLRIIHILTEKSPPTLELINKVRDLYATKLPDVRFLIPILTSLTKAEIIVALPQLIKLSQPVVKEVFNRLLGINVNLPIHKSPVSPAELLVALHQIDTPNCDIKSIIYATSICFSETKIYTQEILAAVIKQLIELNPIPTLFMRTIIQSLQVYPKLSSFVVIMMQRLIGKQIWKYPKIWEGFIKCCQILKATSQQILLQLPSAQLKEVFSQAPDLKDHVCKHVQANPSQRQTISKDNLEIIDQEILNVKNDK